jgi:hypothetical protein
MSGKDMCVCKHAFDKHDEDGVCKHDCDPCAESGFRLDARSSPELTEAEVVALLGYIDRDYASIQEQTRAENILGKVAFQLFGRSLDDLRKRQQQGGEVARR